MLSVITAGFSWNENQVKQKETIYSLALDRQTLIHFDHEKMIIFWSSVVVVGVVPRRKTGVFCRVDCLEFCREKNWARGFLQEYFIARQSHLGKWMQQYNDNIILQQNWHKKKSLSIRSPFLYGLLVSASIVLQDLSRESITFKTDISQPPEQLEISMRYQLVPHLVHFSSKYH